MTEPARLAPWSPAPRPTVWARWTGDLAGVLEAAARAGATRVMLTGERPAPGWLFGAQPPGWRPGAHYLDAALPVARFTHTTTGQPVTIRRAAEWFAGELTPEQAADVWATLERHYPRHVPGGALFDSPGATGLDAWLRSGGCDAPRLDADTAELIRSTSAQHRVELFAHPGTMPGFVYVDGRWQYAALTRELGQGPARWLTAEQAADLAAANPYSRARFHVRATVPDDWDTLGILLEQAGPDPADGWRAPATPGQRLETWCDAAELRLALACGWPVTFLEAVALTQGRPLDTWTERLVRLRDELAALPSPAGRIAAGAVRLILLHGVGSFHSTGRDVVRVVDPMTYRGPEQLVEQGDVWTVRERQPLTGRWAAMAHPEWSAQVWARSHARLLESPTGQRGTWAGALQLPYRQLVGVRGDALYLTADPRWPDDGKTGRLRVKGALEGPMPYPHTLAELNALRARAEATGRKTP